MVERCESCGQELVTTEDHAGGDISIPYCSTCADHNGNLLSRKAIEERLIDQAMDEHDADEQEARQYVRRQMDEMPAWQ